jgi:hypothetical protein
VLVLTSAEDPSADSVVERIEAKGVPTVVLDPGAFPVAATLHVVLHGAGWRGSFSTAAGRADLGAFRSAYWRRPSDPHVMPNATAWESRRDAAEARAAVLGVLVSLADRWVNPPQAEAAAAFKALQLVLAATVGLRPPRTVITNDPSRAREFVRRAAWPVIHKAQYS